MALPIIYSVKRIEQQFYTGEQPVLVMCSDVNTYVCKYMRDEKWLVGVWNNFIECFNDNIHYE